MIQIDFKERAFWMVLVDSKHIHYDAFNLALHVAQINEKFIITHEEHLSIYDGLSTRLGLGLG